jgi:uncharacterized membrane protein
MESRLRSLLKSLTFRLISTIITIVLVFIFSKEIGVSLQIGSIEFFSKFLFYYFHERIWTNFLFGKK